MANEITVRETFDVGAYTGPTGFDDFGAEDIAMPWLRIAAKNTDAAIKDSPDYVEGLEPGFFFKTGGVSQSYGKTVQLTVLKYFKSYGEYKKNEKNPNKWDFVRSVHSSEVRNLTRVGASFPVAGGNIIKESFNYLVIFPDEPKAGILRFSLGAGSFKHVKNFNSMVLGTGAPIWAGVWELTTTLAKSSGGETFYTIGDTNTLVKRVGFIDPAIKDDVLQAFEQAQKFDPDHGLEDGAPF